MPLYNARGNINVTVNDTSMPFGIYAADGSLRVTIVSGSSRTGIYAPDGSYNVVVVSGTDTPAGAYHPSGALYGVAASASSIGLRAPSGAIYMAGLTPSLNQYSFLAESGTYAVQGSVANFLYSRVISALTSSYAISGSDATLSSTTIGPPAYADNTRVAEDNWARITEAGDSRVVESFTTDVLSSLTVTPLAGGQSISATVDCSAKSGTLYIGVYLDTATDPTAAQLEAGTDGDSGALVWSANIPVSTITDGLPGPTTLIQTTGYKMAMAIRLSVTVGDYSNVAVDAFTTLDAAPILASLSVATQGSSGGVSTALFSVVTDDYTGSIKWGYFPSATTPTKSNILNGTGGALAYGSKSVSTTGRKHVIGTTGLAPSTSYKLHAYQIDGSAQESSILSSSAFNTYPNETSQFTLLADGTLTGATVSAAATSSLAQPDVLGGSNAVRLNATRSGTTITANLTRNNATYQDGNNRFRVFLKKGTWTGTGAYIRWTCGNMAVGPNGNFTFNLDTGVLSSIGSAVTLYEAIPLEDGWYYLQWNVNLNVTAGADDVIGLTNFYLSNLSSTQTLSVDGTYQLYLYDYRGTY